jgi:protein TonB
MRALISSVEAPPPPAQAAADVPAVTPARHPSELNDGTLMMPRRIPRIIALVNEQPNDTGVSTPTSDGVPYGVPGVTGNKAITELLRSAPAAAPKPAVQQKVPVSSGVAQGMLIRQVKPQYPPLARQARIQGTVVLQAVMGKDGTVQELRVVSGHPMLTAAAIDAVRQWLYRPYSLNGEAVAVDTQINVNFTLASE